MILSQVDFTQYKSELEKYLKVKFSSSDMFENYIKEKFGTKNSRIFVVNIARAILKNNNQEMDLDSFTDKELIVLINISKNKIKLLESKENQDVKVYLETIDSNNLDLLSGLEKVFDDGKIEKLVLETKKQIDISDKKERKSNNVPYALFVIIICVIATIYSWFNKKDVKVLAPQKVNIVKMLESNESNSTNDINRTGILENNESKK